MAGYGEQEYRDSSRYAEYTLPLARLRLRRSTDLVPAHHLRPPLAAEHCVQLRRSILAGRRQLQRIVLRHSAKRSRLESLFERCPQLGAEDAEPLLWQPLGHVARGRERVVPLHHDAT